MDVSKPIHSTSDKTKVISDVHRATLRALRATNSSSPRMTKMNTAPTVGSKVRIVSRGQSNMIYAPPVVTTQDTMATSPSSIAKA